MLSKRFMTLPPLCSTVYKNTLTNYFFFHSSKRMLLQRALLLILCVFLCPSAGEPIFRPPTNAVDNVVSLVTNTVSGITNAVKSVGSIVAGLNRRVGWYYLHTYKWSREATYNHSVALMFNMQLQSFRKHKNGVL